MKKVLVIDNYDSFTFNLVQLLRESKLCTYRIVANDTVKIDEISEFEYILISPGPGLPFKSGKILEVIRHYGPTKSILGICLGMQAIAECYGAELYNLNGVYHGIKTKTAIIDRDEPLFKGLPNEIETGLYHSWAVRPESIHAPLLVTAISKENVIMGIRHASYNVRGVQFHPESIMTPNGAAMIKNWLLC